jgi:myo-inositol 2-dehydrogenase/D-chiro-inositol 1-dehydrogenase
MTTTLQVGVIGTGGMGGRHARNLAHHTPQAAVTAVMDLDIETAQAVARDCDDAKVYSAADALISDADVAAVVIASPDVTHAALARTCIAAGKPVLCEKPLATTVKDAKGVMDAEVTGGQRLVQLGFMREYDDAHRSVHAVVESGELGRPLYFRGRHANLTESRPRGVEDVIINSAIHDLHTARWLLGGRVVQVFSSYVPIPGAGPESCRFFLTQLTFADGSLATIEVNADSGYGYEVGVEVVCERGSVASDGLTATHIRQPRRKSQPVAGDWLERFEQAYRQEVQSWVQAVLRGTPEGPSTWDGYMSMVIATACVESARSGQPVAVPNIETPALYR